MDFYGSKLIVNHHHSKLLILCLSILNQNKTDGAQGHTDEDTVRPIVRNIILESLQTHMFIDRESLSTLYIISLSILNQNKMDGAQGHMNEDTVRPIVRNIVLESLQTHIVHRQRILVYTHVHRQTIFVYLMHIIMYSKLEKVGWCSRTYG